MNTLSIRTVLLLATASVTVSACGMKFPSAPWMNKDPLVWMGSGENDIPPNSVSLNTPASKLATVLPAETTEGGSMGVFGLNINEYFTDDLKDNSARITRLENVVKAMHRDYAALVPEIQRLSSGHKAHHVAVPAITAAPVSLQSIDTTRTMEGMDTVQANPALEDPINKGPRPVYAGQSAVTGVRVGEHPDRIRIVFDVTKDIKYRADLDNAENIMVVELPNAAWKTLALSESFGKMPVLRSYKVTSANEGRDQILVMNLKGATRILKQATLPALSGGGKRIMIDLAK